MKLAVGRWQGVILALLMLSSLVFSALSISLDVHADGGAPNLAYVSGTTPGVSVIDVGQARVIKTITIEGDPHTILLNSDGSTLYVTQPTKGQVSILAAKTGQIICTARPGGSPTLLALDPNTATLYAAGNDSTRVSALDAGNCAIKHVYETGSPVYGLAVTLPGMGTAHTPSGQLWIAGTLALTVFDDRTGLLLAHIPLASGPKYLSIPPGGAGVYVTTRQGTIEAVDRATYQVRQLLAEGTFGTMDFDEISGEVYVPDEQHNLIDVLAPVVSGMTTLPKEPARVIRLDLPPTSVAITSDGQLGFVALRGGKIAMIDLLERQVIYTVAVTGTPHFIITGLYPPTSIPSLTPTPSTALVLPQHSSPSLLPKIVFTALLIMILALAFFLAWQIHLFLKSAPKSKSRR